MNKNIVKHSDIFSRLQHRSSSFQLDRLDEVSAGLENLSLIRLLRIFGPLGMKDTSFLVASDKRLRRAAAYGFDERGA